MKDFTEWILNIGDGKKASDDGDEMIQIPDDLLLHKGNDTKEVIVQSTYPDLISNYREWDYLQERAIFCPRNDTIEQINEYMMSKIQGEVVMYLSLDSVGSTSTAGLDNMYPMRFLNTLKFSGMPDHEL
jgi:ATP-dependent DNA helicase PIF1